MRSLFLAASFGTSFILFFAAFKTNKISISRESLLIGLFLSLGTICSTLGIMEVLSGSINEIIESKSNRLEAPNIIARYKTQPHTRIKDSILYLAPTNQNFRSFGHEYKTNGMGFRERSFTFKKKAQTFRILVFGDSLTFGVAVSDEQRYTNLLETLLNMSYNKKPSSDYTGLPVADGVIKNDHVEILNFGVPGYTLDQERDLMTVILKLVECDLVIVGVIDDDLNMTTRHSLRGFTINEGNDSVTIPIYKNLERTYQTIPENQPKLFFRSSLWFESLSLFQLLDLKTEWFADNALPTASRWNYALSCYLLKHYSIINHRL